MRKNKVLAVIAIIIALTQLYTVMTFANSKSSEASASDVPFVPVYKEGSYGEYLQNHIRAATPKEIVEINLADLNASENASFKTVVGKENVLVTEETGYIEYKVNIPATGLYSIGVDYYPIKGKSSAIERSVLINGGYLFTEARSASLDRIYKDNIDDLKDFDNFFTQDSYGNQTRREQVENPKWVSNSFLKDSSNYYNGALKFYLEKGENIIRLSSVREPVAISRLWLYGSQDSTQYGDFIVDNAMLNIGGSNLIAKIQAEYPIAKNDPTLFASYDRASPATEPASIETIKLNTMGGNSTGAPRWKVPGQWVEYSVDVPTAGLYKIIIRARQSTLNGGFVSREVTVNNELQFTEAANIRFSYSTDWKMATPSDEFNNPLLFKFNAGENIIRIKAVCGDMTELINAVEAVVSKLNTDYRKILMLTGSNPDIYRDYDFENELPEVVSDLKAQSDILKGIHDELVSVLGESGQLTATLRNVYDQLFKMYEKPDDIAKSFSSFKTNITNLGTWLLSVREQPLEIDYIMVAEEFYKAPAAESGFFSGLWHQIRMFTSSFFTDFNKIAGSANVEYEEEAVVWTLSARDQAQVLRQIVDRSFIPEYKIKLNLELVPAGALLPSILAGKGPDVALGIDSATIINYASRNALQAFDDFEGFAEVKTRFSPSAFVSTSLEVEKGKTLHYGIPETQAFPVLYYRTDIMEELNRDVPKTWDDVYKLIPAMQKRYMDFAPPDYNTLLYQNGGSLYKNRGQATDIDSEIGIETFIQQTDFYTNYKLPVEFNFANRFRMGEMPIGMIDLYSFYNLLSVFAPEIKGLWEFSTVPGVLKEDGSIDNSVVTTVASSVILKGSKNQDNAWKFITWWTDTEAQIEFGREIESVLGAAGRYNSANLEAVSNMNWTNKELNTIMEQWDKAVGYPEMPGGYYLGRYLGFAFTDVVVSYTDARETLLDNIRPINEELIYKRKELGLPLDLVDVQS